MYGNNNRPVNGYGGNYQGYFQQPFQTQAFQYQQPQQAQMALSGRPVTSREEAAGLPMDFTAGAMYMPDLAHGVIYAKIFNANTGEAPLLEFRVAKPEEKKESRNHHRRKKGNAPKAAEKQPEKTPEKPAAPGAAGQIKLHGVPPKTAAMVMAIVAHNMHKPINELRFISIKEVK